MGLCESRVDAGCFPVRYLILNRLQENKYRLGIPANERQPSQVESSAGTKDSAQGSAEWVGFEAARNLSGTDVFSAIYWHKRDGVLYGEHLQVGRQLDRQAICNHHRRIRPVGMHCWLRIPGN